MTMPMLAMGDLSASTGVRICKKELDNHTNKEAIEKLIEKRKKELQPRVDAARKAKDALHRIWKDLEAKERGTEDEKNARSAFQDANALFKSSNAEMTTNEIELKTLIGPKDEQASKKLDGTDDSGGCEEEIEIAKQIQELQDQQDKLVAKRKAIEEAKKQQEKDLEEAKKKQEADRKQAEKDLASFYAFIDTFTGDNYVKKVTNALNVVNDDEDGKDDKYSTALSHIDAAITLIKEELKTDGYYKEWKNKKDKQKKETRKKSSTEQEDGTNNAVQELDEGEEYEEDSAKMDV
jgi:hypothetical protein